MKAYAVYDVLPAKPGMWAVYQTFRIGDPKLFRVRWVEQWEWWP
jgi:hypothetical protein